MASLLSSLSRAPRARTRHVIPALCLLALYLIGSPRAGEAALGCQRAAGQVVSSQGDVSFRHDAELVWQPISLRQSICAGDFIKVGASSRAAIALDNGSVCDWINRRSLGFSVLRPNSAPRLHWYRGPRMS